MKANLFVLTFALILVTVYTATKQRPAESALSVSPSIGSNAVGVGSLRTATGVETLESSASGTVNTTVEDLIMNDYSFFPSFNIAQVSICSTGYFGEFNHMRGSDPGDTVGRISVAASANSSGGGSCTVRATARWRYITASDNPRIWIAHDASGNIVSTWVSDDPPPGDGAPISNITRNGAPIPGLTIRQLTDADFATLPIPAEAKTRANDKIKTRGLKTAHANYRAVQAWANDDAPGPFIHDKMHIVGGQLRCRAACQ